jgi:predicted Zn-dependent peptidase
VTAISQLANGLTVISRPMPGLETASVGLFAAVGSRHEDEPRNGLAHLFEHMVFKGAGGRSARELSEAIEDVGGELNAFTERDQTSFTAAVLGEHLELAVSLLGDLICRPHFERSDLAREAEVVLQELAEAEDTPSDIIFDELWSAAFAGQPLGRSILGSEASVRSIGVEDLVAWRDRHYRGGGLVLAAAGQVEHGRLVELADRHFGRLPGGPPQGPEPAHFTAHRRQRRGRSDQAQLTAGWAGPGLRDEGALAARLFADVAGGGTSSRLFQSIREERGLAYAVSAGLHGHDDIGLLHVHAATARSEARSVQLLVDEVLHDTAATLSQRELDRVRTQVRAGLAMNRETPWGQASMAARQWLVHGRLIEPGELNARLSALGVDDVRAAGQRILAGPRAEATLGLPAVRAA